MERSHNIRSWHLCIFTAGFVEVDPELCGVEHESSALYSSKAS